MGSRRNCLFLTTSDEALLIACAIVGLWRDGFVEPIQPPPEPWHLVAQQAMALVLQEAGRLESGVCCARLAGAFPELSRRGIQGLLGFLLASDILAEQDGLLGFGRRGERLYGRRHFLDLLSSFASPIHVQVRHGAIELGTVDPLSLQGGDGAPCILLLGGRSWRVANVDWSKRLAWVEPSGEQGRARWVASSRALGHGLCQGVKRMLCNDRAGLPLSKRARAQLQGLDAELPQLDPERSTLEHLGGGAFRWWTFAGGRANATLAGLLRAGFRSLRATDFYLEGQGSFDWERVRTLADSADPTLLARRVAKSAPPAVKFLAALPGPAVAAMTVARVLDVATARAMVAQGVTE
jgi:ATP-dependent Lhr-like helicase